MSKTRASVSRPLCPGDTALLRFGNQMLDATVIEDRGRLGVGGRRIFRIRIVLDEETIDFEVPEADLTRPPRGARRTA
jgi:hypothetical protein